MSKFKKIVCKCQKCNKPFSAYKETALCKNCQMEKNIADNGGRVRHRQIRTTTQAADDRFIKEIASDRSLLDITRDLGLDI